METRLTRRRRVALPLLAASCMSMAAAAQGRDTATAAQAGIDQAKATMLLEPALALKQAATAERLAAAVPDPRRRQVILATAQWLQGEANLRLERIDPAVPFIRRALRLIHTADPGSKLEGDVLRSRAGIFQARGNLGNALADLQSAYRHYQRYADRRDEAITLITIASLYNDANDYETSLRYLDNAIDVYRGDKLILLSIYNNKAGYLLELGRRSEALVNYKLALGLATEMNSNLFTARILGNFGRLYLRNGDVAQAEEYLRRADRFAAHGDAAAWRPQLTAIAAQAAYQRGDLAAAASLVNQRFAGVDLATTTLSSREAHQTAYDTYRALGDAPRALAHLAALKRLDDQATKLATTANIALASARFDFANQELRIQTMRNDELRRTVTFEQARARTQRWVSAGIAGATAIVIALLGIGLIVVRRGRNVVAAANADLERSNAALNTALAARTEFLATTSHEIRTPLNGILGMTQVMLADSALAPAVRDRVNVVHAAGVTMRALVDDILDMAKIETGNMTLDPAPFDVAATIEEAARMWSATAHARGIGFALDLDDAPHWVEGDVARVRQVVFNLVSNALKFTANGNITLTVAGAGAVYRIAVADTGIGIPPDKLETIFESFRQADAGTTRRFGGTGLGLAICRNLARAMGGDVTVVSEPGRGSTFMVELPLIAAAAPVPAERPAAVATLVVDRNPITRAMLRALVEKRSEAALAAASIEEAAALVSAGGVARVLVDEATARLAGVEALAGLGGVRVVLLWRGAVPPAATRMPMLSVVQKPVAGPVLLAEIFDTTPQQGRDSLACEAA